MSFYDYHLEGDEIRWPWILISAQSALALKTQFSHLENGAIISAQVPSCGCDKDKARSQVKIMPASSQW